MTDSVTLFEPFKKKMREASISSLAIDNFQYYFSQLLSHENSMLPCSEIEPLQELPSLASLEDRADMNMEELLSTVMVIKLNGGLGTSMGLERAKSLLPAKENSTFLDIIIRQILTLRKKYEVDVPLLFMNSFRTDDDTLAIAERYEELLRGNRELPLSFLQNRVPKVSVEGFAPLESDEDPSLEWCPPGHGDVYAVLSQSGVLDKALEQRIRYAFISNADNLAATLDPTILHYLSVKQFPFLMEVATRTVSDRKGGHLAMRKGGGLVLREVAQCPEEDLDGFQDYKKYRYFNTNSLWVDLVALRELLKEKKNILGLPLIRNKKHFNPSDSSSPMVYQLETAMGAAIEVFEGAQALHIPKKRFLPIKTTNELIGLLSDRYQLDPESQSVCKSPDAADIDIQLDARYYKHIADFEARFPNGVPSLKDCSSLVVSGDILFGVGVRLVGDVTLANKGEGQVCIEDGAVFQGNHEFA